METIDIVKELLAENLDIEGSQIEAATSLESLGIDSLDMVELVCDLEERCGIEFGEAAGIETIGELVAHIDGAK